MQRKIYGIFVAGGSGSRMGSALPKQFIELEGIPILQRTIERFLEAVPGLKVIVVLPGHYIEQWKTMCLEGGLDCPQIIVPGGITRFHSVRNALDRVPDGAVVMIHDGVRPLLSADMIRSMLDRILRSSSRALVPAVPVVDTLRTRDGSPAPDRSNTVAVQTPQIFLSEDIKAAYGHAYSDSFTDDASVAEANGIRVDLCPGERFNIKITTPEDLVLARAIVNQTL